MCHYLPYGKVELGWLTLFSAGRRVVAGNELRQVAAGDAPRR